MRDAGRTPPKRPVLLATDGSPVAAHARAIAVDLCVRSGAPLHIVHVWGVTGSFRVITSKTDDEVRDELARDASELVAHEAAIAAADGIEVAGYHVIHDGPGTSVLLTAHNLNPALVVMGSHGRGMLGRAVLGSVSETVVRRGHHPILVVHEDSPWPPRRVVVGDDGSEDAHRACTLAAQVARLYDVGVVLVHGRRSSMTEVEGVPPSEWLAERALLLGEAEACDVTSVVLDGDAAHAIGRVASETNALVVLGAHRRSADAGSHDSVSTFLLRHLRLPLVVVPPARAQVESGSRRGHLEVAR